MKDFRRRVKPYWQIALVVAIIFLLSLMIIYYYQKRIDHIEQQLNEAKG
jgi:hypothetical protein